MTSLPPCLLSARAILSWMAWRAVGRETVFRDSLNWVWMTHFACSFSKNLGDASSHQTLPVALRCVPTGLMSSYKALSYLQEKGHGNNQGSHEGQSSALRPLYPDLLK